MEFSRIRRIEIASDRRQIKLPVKMDNPEGLSIILPYLGEEDLLATTLKENTLLHLALAAGKAQSAKTVYKRARELGIADELIGKENCVEYTPEKIYSAFMVTGEAMFREALNTIEHLLGGEENVKPKKRS